MVVILAIHHLYRYDPYKLLSRKPPNDQVQVVSFLLALQLACLPPPVLNYKENL
jgi:hypothetical protein